LFVYRVVTILVTALVSDMCCYLFVYRVVTIL